MFLVAYGNRLAEMVFSNHRRVVMSAATDGIDCLLLDGGRSCLVRLFSDAEHDHVFTLGQPFSPFFVDVPDFGAFAGNAFDQGRILHHKNSVGV